MPQVLLDVAAGRSPPPTELQSPVLDLAWEHRVSGLLWSWAQTRDVGDEARAWLALRDLRVQAHLRLVETVLREVSECLSGLEIPAVTIKGITAEARWYDRRGERPCSDVDIVLHPDHRHRVADAVRALQPDHPWAHDVGALVRTGGVQSVTLRHRGLEVDLHLDLLKLGIPTRCGARWWDFTEEFDLGDGSQVRVLDDSLSLVNLLLHVNKDRFQRLLGYADIPRIIDHGKVDWERFLWIVRAEGHEAVVLSSLDAVLGTLERSWPAEVPRPSGPRTLAWRCIWRPGIRLRGQEGRLRFRRRQNLIGMLARGRMLEAVRWWGQELWPPRAAVEARYGDIPGPYLWKLLRGRMRGQRQQREQLARSRSRA